MSTSGHRVRVRHAATAERLTHSSTGSDPAVRSGEGYYGAGQAAQEQVAEGGIQPGAVGTEIIRDSALSISKFTTDLRPVGIVGALPTLPDANYPVGATVVLTTNGKLYRNDADVWTATVAATDLNGAILARNGGVEPVAALPSLPDADYPVGSVVFLESDEKLYKNAADVWVDAAPGGSGGPVAAKDGGVEPVAALPTLPDADYPTSCVVILTTDGKLYRNVANVWTATTPTSDLTGQIAAGQIAANAVTANEIAADAVTAGKIAAGAVTAAKIAANTITAAEIATGAITADELAVDAVTAGKIAAGAVTAAKIDTGAVTAAKIGAGQIEAGHLAADSVTAGAIAAGAVSTSELAVGARLTGEVANEAGGSPGVFIDSTGILIRSGKLTLQDEFAKTALEASGFSGNWADFVQMGLYNARFLSGTAGVVPNGRTSALPFWTLANSVGSPVATFIANSGVRVTFAALGNRKSFTSDSVVARPYVNYHLTFTASSQVAAGIVVLQAYLDWFKADGTASATPTTTFAAVSFSATVTDRNVNVLMPAQAPADARFVKVRFTIEESVAHNASNFLTVHAAALREIPAYNFSGNGAFPASPAQYDRFFRSDLGMEFFWSGAYWLSTTRYQMVIPNAQRALQPNSATVAANFIGATPPLEGGDDIYLEHADLAFQVTTGGTALGASHKWVVTLTKAQNGSTTETGIATFNIDSGASAQWRILTVNINALLNSGTIHRMFIAAVTKTGTPGALYAALTISYRIRAT